MEEKFEKNLKFNCKIKWKNMFYYHIKSIDQSNLNMAIENWLPLKTVFFFNSYLDLLFIIYSSDVQYTIAICGYSKKI